MARLFALCHSRWQWRIAVLLTCGFASMLLSLRMAAGQPEYTGAGETVFCDRFVRPYGLNCIEYQVSCDCWKETTVLAAPGLQLGAGPPGNQTE